VRLGGVRLRPRLRVRANPPNSAMGGRLTVEWFKPRGYVHFDAPVGNAFAQKVLDRAFVAKHSWLPLIYYIKRTKRYKASKRKTVFKNRPIMYASHRDACILSKYAWELTTALDAHYKALGLDQHVIAYRKLGRANYDFSADAFNFARARPISVVLCYDITGFFDNLDHRILKERLKRVLELGELAQDWFAVFRHVTQYKMIERAELAAHSRFGPRLSMKLREPLATIAAFSQSASRLSEILIASVFHKARQLAAYSRTCI
jgi:RNA-directed DNA polymerase